MKHATSKINFLIYNDVFLTVMGCFRWFITFECKPQDNEVAEQGYTISDLCIVLCSIDHASGQEGENRSAHNGHDQPGRSLLCFIAQSGNTQGKNSREHNGHKEAESSQCV